MPVQSIDRERILVCVSASPTSSDVIRRAAKLSESLGAELIALYVENSEIQNDAQEKAVHEHLDMAQRLGAVITTIYGNDPATAIAQYARVSGITKIVLGKSPSRKHAFAARETLMSRLNELAPDVEIMIVPNRLKEDTGHFSIKRILQREPFTAGDLLKTALILALCTGVGFLFSVIGLAITNVVLIYILGVMAVALFTAGYLCSLLSSLLSVLIFNFFFTEPYYSLQSSPDYFATFAVMFAVALLSSSLTSRIKAQSIQTANKAYQTEVLLSTSQLLQKAEDKKAILKVVLQQLCRLLEHSVLYYDLEDGILAEKPVLNEIEGDHGFDQIDLPAEKAVAEWVGRNGKHAGHSTRKWPQSKCLYMAIRGENRVWAVVGIRADNSPSIDEYRKNLTISILDECALALEKDHMTREKQRIEESARQEALRANLLRAISHDLRTPLTSISGNAAILLEDVPRVDVARHDGGQDAAVQEAVDPLEDEGIQRKLVHEPAHLIFAQAAQAAQGGGDFCQCPRDRLLRGLHDEDGVRGGEDQTRQQADAAAEAVGIDHRHPVELVAQVQHIFLHQEDAAEEFHGPEDDGGRLDEEGGPGEGGAFLEEQAQRRESAEHESDASGLVPEGFVVQLHRYKGNIKCFIFKKSAYLCKIASINSWLKTWYVIHQKLT